MFISSSSTTSVQKHLVAPAVFNKRSCQLPPIFEVPISQIIQAAMEFIPVELTTQILSMLPARSVLRCRAVCKTWRSLIDEPGFAALHLDREIEMESHPGNTKQTRLFLFPPYYDESDFPVYLVEQQQDSHVFKCTKMPLSLPETTSSSAKSLSLTAVNGLFSIYDYWVHHSFICNPSTGQFVMLPQLHSENLGGGWITSGLGYDISNGLFKAVQIISPYDMSSPAEAYVYTLGSNSSWKRLDNAPSINCTTSAVAVNGHLHWLPNGATSILSLELASESFGVLPLPRFKSSEHGLVLKSIDGLLSILYMNGSSDVEIWVMKDYGVAESWTKFVVSRTNCKPLAFVSSIQPISFWEEGEIILLCDSRILVSYNLECGRYTPLLINGLPNCHSYQVFPCAGNLLAL